MSFLLKEAPESGPSPYLRIFWAVAILAFCVIFQMSVLLAARQGLGKNLSFIASLILGLILPAVLIVIRLSPNPCETLRLNGIPFPSAICVVGSAVCFTILATFSIEFALRTWELPAQFQVLLEEEERLLREAFRFETALDLFTVAAAVVVIAPVAEELLFRGLLQGSLERRLGGWAGVVAAGLVFGLLHGRLRFLPVSLLGILMGYMVMRTNSILSGVLAHSCNNGLVLALGVSAGPEFLPLTYLIGGVILGAAGLIVFLWFFRRSTLTSPRIPRITWPNAPSPRSPHQGSGTSKYHRGPA
jgi:membrane protease YdiL (CAAX protease family)